MLFSSLNSRGTKDAGVLSGVPHFVVSVGSRDNPKAFYSVHGPGPKYLMSFSLESLKDVVWELTRNPATGPAFSSRISQARQISNLNVSALNLKLET